MMPRWSRTLAKIYNVGKQSKSGMAGDLFAFPSRRISTAAAVDVPVASDASKVSDKLPDMRNKLQKVINGNYGAISTLLVAPNWVELIWEFVFFEDESSDLDFATALLAVESFTRYLHREYACLYLTDKEAVFTGNFMFTSLDNPKH